MRQQQYEDRWSGFGEQAGIVRFSEALPAGVLQQIPLFRAFDPAFLDRIAADVSVARWAEGAVLFEEGSYLDLAFYVLEGRVDLFLQRHEEASRPIFHPRARGAGGAGAPAAASGAGPAPRAPGAPVTFLASMDFDLGAGEVVHLGPGDLFGEIGALNGWPQSVTARAGAGCTLVQIRLPALRAMKAEAPAFQQQLDRLYRERTLAAQLRTTPLLHGVSGPFLDALLPHAGLVSCAPGAVVAREGEAAEAVYLVRSGFVRLSQRIDGRDVVVSYLSKGMTLGEVELLVEGVEGWQHTATAAGYTELVRLPRADFTALVRQHPAVEQRLWEHAVALLKTAGYTRRHFDRADLVDFALARGLVQASSLLVIDLDRCTRCDDCVRGCADTHGGRPRFAREGEKYGRFLVAQSCYHCEDPVCLVGCPTGAIRRANVGAVVEIDERLCIGCGNCVARCPYHAITLDEVAPPAGARPDAEGSQGRSRRVASKCDLCHTSAAGPACVSSCPHGCAFRVDRLEAFQELLGAGR